MSILTLEGSATSVSFDTHNMWVRVSNGRQLGVTLAYFPRLARATTAQRKNYVISGGGNGLHWDDLDEDISVHALLAGRVDRSIHGKKRTKKAA